MKRIGVIFLCAIFFLLIVNPTLVLAHHRARVLGATTSNPVLPATVEGPGFILPDSPLYFLDNLKQNARLFFAFTPAAKAKIYSDIASERLAELNFMLAKKNEAGVDVALEGVSENLKKAANEIEKAQLSGKDVTKISQQVNASIKTKQEALDSLESQAVGEFKAKVAVINAGVMESKVTVEDGLPEEDLQKEIELDLERNVTKQLAQASDSAKNIEANLDELLNQQQEAGQNALTRREEALQKAIDQQNEALKKDEQRTLEFERKRNDELLKLEAREAQLVKETVAKAQEAATKFSNTREQVKQVKKQPVGTTFTTPIASNSSSTSVKSNL